MKKQTVLVALTTLLATSLFTLGSAEAGLIKVVNNSNFVLGVGVTYSDGSKSGPDIINPNSYKPALGSPVKTVTKIRVVNTTSGTDPGKMRLLDYQEQTPSIMKDYLITVDNQGAVAVTSNKPANF